MIIYERWASALGVNFDVYIYSLVSLGGKPIPKYLESTYMMLKSTFPNGIGDEEYFPLISLLYEYMSDRNLAKVISSITEKDITITINDIQKQCQQTSQVMKS
ncbi:DUF3349 domain-containing protein [Paenibacillus thiaminolyticus]|uniref:DUF3349 domain-containing protein n=1 Tax=Paenibacillus thiaminolyticus TaxID=49283 RepID=A0AAP9J2R6_PANTH|nr:DUF3349 domain-containing protein [Paenibacillus thiaminolyticus]